MPFDTYRAILDSVTSAVTGLPTTGAYVFESPAAALDSGKLPALAVLVREVDVVDVVESADTDAHLERHRVGIWVQTISRTRNERDTSSLEVKEAILMTLRPGVARRYRRTDFEQSARGEAPLWGATQRFEIDYDVEADNPSVIAV